MSALDTATGHSRLDAGYHLGLRHAGAVNVSGSVLRDVADAYLPGRFKRPWARKGVPFIGSREMFFWPLRPTKFLAKGFAELKDFLVDPGVILVRRSGSVGEVAITSSNFSGVAVTEDAIRVIPTGIAGGYLYAYLSSDLGQTLLKANEFGGVINHLETRQILELQVPRTDGDTEARIGDLIRRTTALRGIGSRLLALAEECLLAGLGLPPFEDVPIDYLPGNGLSTVPAFLVPGPALAKRLDGSFHAPEATAARTTIAAKSKDAKPLREIADVDVPGRFARVYVAKEHGIPFLQGTHVPMARPIGLKFLSRVAHEAQVKTHTLNEREVLVTASGTLGRVGYVTSAQNGWIGSQHVARIRVHEGYEPGYLYAFLASRYGQVQLEAQTYGAVVDELSAAQIGDVLVSEAPKELQVAVGRLVERAFRLRDLANSAESHAMEMFEQVLGSERTPGNPTVA